MMAQKCDLDSIQSTVEKNPRVALLYTGKGCPACPPYAKLVRQELKGSRRVKLVRVEVGKGEDACELAADRLNIDATPTLLYFENGRLQRTIGPTGDSNVDRKNIRSLK